MDPTTIDLTTIGGIVALTMTLVHILKHALADVPWVSKLPVAVYAVLVSAGLTYVARDVLELLAGGSLAELIIQSVMQALVAAGALEWKRAGLKPLEATSAAKGVTDPWDGGGAWSILLVLGLSAGIMTGCAKSTPALVQADATVYTVLAGVQDGADALAAQGLISTEQRQAIAPHLLTALRLGDTFNRAVRAGTSSTTAEAIPPLLDALRVLHLRLSDILPPGVGRDLIQAVERAIGMVPVGGK